MDVRVSRKRVLRVMREANLLSPRRRPGVAERFIRTMKEQAIYGRVFKNVEEVREAVAAFLETYHTPWRLEKLGFMTPKEKPVSSSIGPWLHRCSCVSRGPGPVHSGGAVFHRRIRLIIQPAPTGLLRARAGGSRSR